MSVATAWPLVGALAPILLAVFSLVWPPKWVAEDAPLKSRWTLLNLGGLALSFVCIAFVYMFSTHDDSLYLFTNVLGAGVLAFVFFQTLFTDFRKRLADRRLFWIANGISLAWGTTFLVMTTSTTIVLVYLAMFLCATVVVFLPMIGSSDGRALQLVVLAGFPVLGFVGVTWALNLLLVIILLWLVGLVIWKRTLKALFMKISQPLVPIILAPFVVAVTGATLILAG